MADYKLIIQRIGLVGLTNILLSLSGIILLPILTKNMPVEDYGIWAQVSVTVGIVPAVAMLGFPYAMARFLPSSKSKEENREIFYSVFFIVCATSLFASSILYIVSEKLAFLLFDSNITVVRILSITVFFESMNGLFLGYFRASQQIKKHSVAMFGQTVLNFLLVAFFVLLGKGIVGAIYGVLLKSFIVSLASFLVIASQLGFQVPSFGHLKEYLAFGFPTIPGNLSSWVVNSSDRYVIGILLGTAAVGYYSPGYSLGNLIRMFVAPVSFMLPVVLAKYYDEQDIDTVKTILSYSLKYFLAVAIPSVFGLSLLSKPLLSVLSTPEIALQGYLITPFVALSALFSGTYSIITQVIIMEKKTKVTGTMWILSAALNLGLNFLFVPFMGILGAAFTTLIAFILNLIFTSSYSFKKFRFDLNIGFIFKSIFASVLMSSIILFTDPVNILEILVTVVLCAITYFGILGFLKGFGRQEIQFCKEIINY